MSPGLYYIPAVAETVPPTASQAASYARQSGQTWTSDHPQTWNIAGLDYGVGPNQPISSLKDIAHWPKGQYGCAYHASGYTAHGWPPTMPVLACDAYSATVTISGYDFGPNGSHDCVSVFFDGSTTQNSNVRIQGNAFINGALCGSALIGGSVATGLVSVAVGVEVNLAIWNNYVDMRWYEPCCTEQASGIFFASNQQRGNLDLEYNYIKNCPRACAGASWLNGNEPASCNNGTSYAVPGYDVTVKYNWIGGIGNYVGSGHGEVITPTVKNNSTYICQMVYAYNTVMWPAGVAATATTTFYSFATSMGTMELFDVNHNTIYSNVAGGATNNATLSYWNWHTTNGTPNEVVIDDPGFSCATCSTGPVQGILAQAGYGFGLKSYDPVSGAWRAGCNIAGGTICPSVGYSIAPGSFRGRNTPFQHRPVAALGASPGGGCSSSCPQSYTYGEITFHDNYMDGTGALSDAYWKVNVSGPGCGSGPVGSARSSANGKYVYNNHDLRTNALANKLSLERGRGC